MPGLSRVGDVGLRKAEETDSGRGETRTLDLADRILKDDWAEARRHRQGSAGKKIALSDQRFGPRGP